MRLLPTFLFALTSTLLIGVSFAAAEPFQIQNGDRVLLLGDTLLEREGTYGFFETRMHAQFPDRRFSVRNLAYSADTPLGRSRSVFDGPEKGWARLREQIAMVKPTVVFLGYGMASSMDFVGSPTDRMAEGRTTTEEKAARFAGEMGQLMDAIKAVDPATNVRFVLLNPIRHEDLRAALPTTPDPLPHNQALQQIGAVLEKLSKERGAALVSPFETHAAAHGLPQLTDNGIHLTEPGYQRFAEHVATELGWSRPATGTDEAATQALRRLIQKKSELFFHRWRPQNETYLFGFRKHEQGQNAREIPMFDPLIEKAEDEIFQVKSGAQKAPTAQASAPEAPTPTSLPLPKFDVQDGYEISLWAENPLLEKPVQMNWDAKGRLWVASSGVYPQIEPGAPATDRILLIEDTDRDGHGDKSTVFAEGLLIPTGVTPDTVVGAVGAQDPSKGDSCYVGQSTELLRLVDTDGDGKADRREIVLSGFGTEDTHHLVHTLRWGPDGRLYFNQSIYIHSHIETPWGVVRQNSGGVLAWDPRSKHLEVLYNGFCNPWGHTFNEWGESFMTDGAGFQGITWGVRGAGYFTYEGGRRLLQSISPGTYPKFCGLEIVRSPHFPAEWQGSMVTADFRAHRIVRFGVTDLGEDGKDAAALKSGYVTTEMPDIVRTSDVSFRPIDVKLGPDGALYVADWSNPVINHGEVDFRDPRRDKTRGRIWRITRKGGELIQPADLLTQPVRELTEKLLSKNIWEQDSSRRLLMQRNTAEFETGLKEWSSSNLTDAQRRELTWVLLGRGLGDPSESRFLLARSANPQARAWAARLIGSRFSDDLARLPQAKLTAPWGNASAAFDTLIKDSHPRVRLEAARSLALLATGGDALAKEAASKALTAATAVPESDPFYDYAAWLSVNDLAQPWAAAVLDGAWKIDSPDRERQLEFALSAIPADLAGKVLGKIVADRGIPADGAGPWIELLAKAGRPADLDILVRQLAANGFSTPEAARRALTALAEAARLRNTRPSGDLTIFLKEYAPHTREHPAQQVALVRLAAEWKITEAVPKLASLAQDAATAAALRAASIEALRDLGGQEAEAALLEVVKASPFEVQRLAALALAAMHADRGVPHALRVVRSASSEAAALEMWRALFQLKGAADKVADLLKEESTKSTGLPPASYATSTGGLAEVAPKQSSNALQPLSKLIATTGLRAARELGKQGEKVAAHLAPLAGVNPAAARMAEDYHSVAELVKRDGDPSRGEEIYRRAQLGCITCHAIGGAGGKVGPELTSMGASAPLDYIIESIIDPTAKVKEGYHAVLLTLKDGTVASGIQSRETADEIFLRDVVGQESAVPKAKLMTRETMGSIMPAGLVDSLQPREKLDLYAFLGQLGKPGVYDASKGTAARYWALTAQQPDATAANALQGTTPVYTLVDGRLTRELLQHALEMLPGHGETVFVTARFHVASDAKPRIALTGISKAWLDGKPLAIASEPSLSADMTAGEHLLTVELSLKQLPEVLRADSADVRFLGN